MTKYQKDEFSIRDGKIKLYRRADSPGKIWQCRFNAKGKAIRLSTNESNQHAATAVAGDLYDEIRFKIKNDIPIGRKSFKSVWEEWKSAVPLSSHRVKYIRITGNRYILPFFGAKPITAINTAQVSEYWAWRETQPIKGPPSAQTLVMDAQLLTQFLKWAAERNYLRKVPEIKSPKKRNPKASRRPVFSKDDILHMLDFSIYWVNRSSNQQIRRGYCFGYVSLILYSGLRPKEARLLKWRDVQQDQAVLLNVNEQGKTGERTVVALPAAGAVLDYIRGLGGDTSPDAYVFPGAAGGATASFEHLFKSMVTYLGLTSEDSRDRTIYSLRHTYTTFRLIHGKVDVFKLASNLGTSAETIRLHYAHVLNQNMAGDLNQNDQSGFDNEWGVSLQGFG